MKLVLFIDHLLRDRESVINDLLDAAKAKILTLQCFKIFVILCVIYGFIMGSFCISQGHFEGSMYSIASMIKLPMLFLLTLVICLPLFYVLNVLAGPRASFSTVFAIVMASLAVTSILLAACALILAFFMLSTDSYAFIVLLNVIIFTISALYGIWFLGKAVAALPKPEEVKTTSSIVRWWLITYGIVGTQMAWMMRPFIGSPDMPFSFFREQGSNFYVTIGKVIGAVLGIH